jgi:NAD(P)-dependent dehydrogenase (short-subunit alcohol dehydrogenase family)
LKNTGDYIISTTPLQRIGTMADIGGTVIYLASRAGSWVTGTVLTLDGGSVLKANL